MSCDCRVSPVAMPNVASGDRAPDQFPLERRGARRNARHRPAEQEASTSTKLASSCALGHACLCRSAAARRRWRCPAPAKASARSGEYRAGRRVAFSSMSPRPCARRPVWSITLSVPVMTNTPLSRNCFMACAGANRHGRGDGYLLCRHAGGDLIHLLFVKRGQREGVADGQLPLPSAGVFSTVSTMVHRRHAPPGFLVSCR